MDIGTFYSLFSATCFTLVGLWWNVVERRSGWAADPRRRRLAGGIYAVSYTHLTLPTSDLV